MNKRMKKKHDIIRRRRVGRIRVKVQKTNRLITLRSNTTMMDWICYGDIYHVRERIKWIKDKQRNTT